MADLLTIDTITEIDASALAPDEASAVHEFRLSTPDFTFRGAFPDVPVAAGVDMEALTTGDANPLFVVRPLAIVGAVSDRNLKYDIELCEEIRQQVIDKKPAARQGHVSDQNADWEFPDDVGLWVGAVMVGDTLWGKCYIYPNTSFHQMVVKRKAAGSTLSNSIWGKGLFGANADGTRCLRNFDLETIDFAPAERAALEALGGQFDTTSEMKKQGVSEMAGESADKEQDLALVRSEIAKMAPHALHEMMTKDQRQHCAEMHVREMEPSAVYEMLPAAHRQGIHDSYAKEFGQKLAAEMAIPADFKQRVSEMESALGQQKTIIARYEQEKFEHKLNATSARPFEAWHVKLSAEAVASAKKNYEMYIVAEMAAMDGGQKLDNIEVAAEKAWPKYEPQAALLLRAASGGNTITGVSEMNQTQNNYGYDPKTGKYDTAAVNRFRGLVAPHTAGGN